MRQVSTSECSTIRCAFTPTVIIGSNDAGKAFSVAKQLRAGHAGINTAQGNHDTPLGGFKMSGDGRNGGDYGLLASCEVQSIIWTI